MQWTNPEHWDEFRLFKIICYTIKKVKTACSKNIFPHLGNKLDLLQQLLLRCVLDQVIVNPPLPVAKAVPGNMERPLRRLEAGLN